MNALITFQTAITTTGTPQQLPSNPVVKSITITSKGSNNASGVAIGNSNAVTSNSGYILAPGASVPVELANGDTSALWIIGTSGDVVSVVGV